MTDAELIAWSAKRGKKLRMEETPGAELPPADEDLNDGKEGLDAFNAGGDDTPQNTQNETKKDLDETAQLRAQLDAALGRLAPAQRQMEELAAANKAAQLRIAEMEETLQSQKRLEAEAKLKAEADAFNPFEGLSQEEIEALDDVSRSIIDRTARATYAKARSTMKDPEELINKALSELNARTMRNYMTATAKELKLFDLEKDAAFAKFLEEDDSGGLLLNQFVRATDIDMAKSLEPRVRKMLKRFENSTSTQSKRQPDPQDRLSSQLDRNTRSSGGKRPNTAEEVASLQAEAKRLARAGLHKEANAVLARL